MANKNVVADSSRHLLFWDFPMLERASLKQPVVAQLANRLGWDGLVVTMEDFIQTLCQRAK